MSFKILSYNLLADIHQFKHSYLYSSKPIQERLPLITKTILELNPDVVCLQESMEFTLKNYKNIFMQKTKDEGLSILVGPAFEVIAHTKISFNRNKLLNRPNIGLCCILRHLKTKELILVANTHILFNKKRGLVKLAQVHLLLYESYLFAKKFGLDIPVVICGDWNFSPDCLLTKYLLGHCLPPCSDASLISQKSGPIILDKDMALSLRHPFVLEPLILDYESRSLVSFCNLRERGLVDNIFFGYLPKSNWETTIMDGNARYCDLETEQKEPKIELIRRFNLPRRNQATPIPDCKNGSDHYPLCAEFKLNV